MTPESRSIITMTRDATYILLLIPSLTFPNIDIQQITLYRTKIVNLFKYGLRN